MKLGHKVRFEYRDIRNDRTRIDAHVMGAALLVIPGLLPVGIYWFAFNQFGTSQLPWKIAFTVVISCVLASCASYVLNRRSRRLFWEGATASVSVLVIWMVLGSYWLFYFGFAPMPSWVRVTALTFSAGLTCMWILWSWRNYQRVTVDQDLVSKLYIEESGQIVYPGAESDMAVACIASPWKGLNIPYRAFSIVAPLVIAYAFVSQRVFEKSGGPHSAFIILSILSLPLSNGILGQFLVRTVFFHVYLALKLEKKTGKKVILGP
jgi:hypothetical protein